MNNKSFCIEFTPFFSPTGYVFLISIVVVAFVAFYLVIRNPERREILRNLIKFKSTSNVQYTRVSRCSFLMSNVLVFNSFRTFHMIFLLGFSSYFCRTWMTMILFWTKNQFPVEKSRISVIPVVIVRNFLFMIL